MKRTPWISWRTYFLASPISILVLVFAADHKLDHLRDVVAWAFVALIAYLSLTPFIFLAIAFSNKYNKWQADLLALIGLGIIRGLVINLCVEQFNLVLTVSENYKVFNSAVALPQWFIGIAVFIESRRAYQREFQALFTRAMLREQETEKRQGQIPKGDSYSEEILARFQSITSNLANDINALLKSPNALKDYSLEASRIQNLINEDLRPASTELWQSHAVSTPKISFKTLVQISLLGQRLRVVLVVLVSTPYLFVGLNGAYGFTIAFAQCLIVSSINLIIFGLTELLFILGILNRTKTNVLAITATVSLPLFVQLNLPLKYTISDNPVTIFLGQCVLSATFGAILLTFNCYKVINEQRSEAIASLQRQLSGEKYSATLNASRMAGSNTDIAKYLHGEIQAGLTASSLLLQQAEKTGNTFLAMEALESAARLLNQNHADIFYTRMEKPEEKLEKIIAGWKGIADITISLPSSSQLDDLVLQNSVALIEEAISNSIRHAHATEIRVSSILDSKLLTINVFSNGDSMTSGKGGLGTKLFNQLASEWNFTNEIGQNRLTFILINKI